jgi:ATP-binding cassette, subfamily F, member 3
MLTLQNVAIARGSQPLIEQINFSVYPKQIVGLIGDNGSGKSSLFAAIRGELEPGEGDIHIVKNSRVTSLAQEVATSELSAIDFTLSGNTVLFATLTQLARAEETNDYAVMMECHTKLHDIDGYSAQSRAAKILKGLGFADDQMQSQVASFSGGWRMRLSLAKCLFEPSDLLLLDEPTNHLDMEAIIWLENFLRHYPGAVLLISHDQDFLDNTVTHIAHIEQQCCKLYTGNYSSFEIQRAQQIALQNAQAKKQQVQVKHMQEFVDKFGAKATKARQAQSRLKAIEKMEIIKPIYESSGFYFQFQEPDRMPNPMLTMSKADLGYDQQHPVIKWANMSIRAGERIGLLGVNGAGKSTLIKSLCGHLKPLQGTVERPANLSIGYFDQHQVDHLPLDRSTLSLLNDLSNNRSDKDLINYLASFGFSRDQSLAPLQNFSGGEKSRVALALIVWQRPNLLLLDEPTNHLDLTMRQALTFALQEYTGAMILVSHDRHLLRTLVDELYLLQDGRLTAFDGTVEDYQRLCA